jgi:hypothetical protein
MKTLQDATVQICDLKGSLLAMHCVIAALARTLPPSAAAAAATHLQAEIEAATATLLAARVSEHTLGAFERDARLLTTRFQDRAPT